MLNQKIDELSQQSTAHELNDAEWSSLGKLYIEENDDRLKAKFIKTIETYSGIPCSVLQQAFDTLRSSSTIPKQITDELQTLQQQNTLKISSFQKHPFFSTINLQQLFISRLHWNTLINKFEQKNRKNLTSYFFLTTLSNIQKITVRNLTAILSDLPKGYLRKRPASSVEKKPLKRYRATYVEDEDASPLIYEKRTDNPELEAQLEAAGAEIMPSLQPATPTKEYPCSLKRTPNGKKVRPVCVIGEHSLFKYLSPQKTNINNGRLQIPDVPKKDIKKKLPKLNLQQAVTVEYIATLPSIIERSGLTRRENASSEMGASAKEVFMAYKVDYKPEKGAIHWSHLIAHFLTDSASIISETPDEEVVNLVPTTAACNYNALESIEIFIRDKLINEETDKIRIRVTPEYSGEQLIPSLLIYELDWEEVNNNIKSACHEIFTLNPQSCLRITKSMHEVIRVLRKTHNPLFFESLNVNHEQDAMHSKTSASLL